jgi:hypothetical protein
MDVDNDIGASASKVNPVDENNDQEAALDKNPLEFSELPVLSTEDLDYVKVDEVKREINLLETERTK